MPQLSTRCLALTGRRAWTPAVIATTLLLAGCGGKASGIDLQTPAPEVTRSNAPVATSPTPTPSLPSPTATPAASSGQTDQQLVLTAYSAYYDNLGPISALPAADRPSALARFTVDPLYSTALTELAARDAANKIVYGKLIVNPRVTELKGDVATIQDCQDASHFGLMNRSTGEKLTVGVNGFEQVSQMLRGSDGTWRLSTVLHAPEAKC